MKPQFRNDRSKIAIKKQLSTRPRFTIDKSAKSHAMLTHESSRTTSKPTIPQLSQSEQRQMLGHLADIEEVVPRQSAILLPLCTHHGIPSLLFIKRGSKRSSHRGQVAFPGGMFDLEDNNDPITCAYREMMEEIGLTKDQVSFIGIHHDAGTSDRSRNIETGIVKSTIITPVIGLINKDLSDLPLNLSLNELDYAFTIPLQQLLSFDQWHTYKTRPAYTYSHQDINHIILPRNQPEYYGCEYKFISNEEFDLFTSSQTSSKSSQAQKMTSTKHNTDIVHNSNIISLNNVSPNLHELSMAQLQYLESLEQQGLYQDVIPSSIHITDTSSQYQSQYQSQLQQQSQSQEKKIIYVPKTEILWGASAHITSLFLKQVMEPIYKDITA